MNNSRGSRSRTGGHRKAKRLRSNSRHSSGEDSHSVEAHNEPPVRINRTPHMDNACSSRTGTSHSKHRQTALSSTAWDISSYRRNNDHQKLLSSSSNAWDVSGYRRNQDHQRTPSSSYETRGQTRLRPSASSPRPSVASSCHPSTNAQQSAPQMSDIPGYYYDEMTKLYFKVQPYNLGIVAPFITRDKIATRQKENQRLKDVQNFTSQNLPVLTTVSRLPATTHRHRKHLISVLQNVQSGQLPSENMRSYMCRHMCSRLEPDVRWENSIPGQPSLHLEAVQVMEVSKNREKIACVTSLKHTYSQMIQLLTVNEHQQSFPEGQRSVLRVTVPSLAVGPIHKRIKTLCWALMTGRPDQATVLYTTVCPIGCSASIAYLSNLEPESGQQEMLFELNLGKTIIWSTAWNTQAHRLSIGAERKCHLIDVATRKQWSLSTCDSDPLSQLFSVANPYIYNGTRKGFILLHDVRAANQERYKLMMRQGAGIGCLRLLRDENYLMASDFSGTICTWDQRMRKAVMEFDGLMNSHWQLPFHVDETETVLTSTGSDSYTKIWDMTTGQVLRSIPPPDPVSSDGFPLSFYSTRWAGRDGNNALLLAMRNNFSFYTYKETLH